MASYQKYRHKTAARCVTHLLLFLLRSCDLGADIKILQQVTADTPHRLAGPLVGVIN